MSGAEPDRAGVVADYKALRHGVGARRLDRDVVVVAGPDALGYLQGQLSQDVGGLVPGGSVPSLLLEPDGKLCALVRVVRTGEDRFALDVDGGFGDAVAARLRRFRLRTKVDIDEVDWPCVALRGEGVEMPAGGAPPEPPEVDGPRVVPVAWNGTFGVDLLGPGAEAAVPEGARWVGEAAWQALRIEAGIPAMGTELDGRTIAAEAGLVERTVSFTKGCYTGQELVARLDARGSRVARRLCGVVFAPWAGGADGGAGGADGGLDAATPAGADLWIPGGDKPVGRCTSAAWCPGVGGWAGLAYLHRSVDVPSDLEWSPTPSPSDGSGSEGSGPAGGTGSAPPRHPARAAELPLDRA